MSDHSVYATYPETPSTLNDGKGITIETCFYTLSSGWRLKGIKLFVPAGSSLVGQTVTLAAWVPGVAQTGLNGTPQASASVTLAAGWNQTTFAPIALTSGQKIGVSYTSAGDYLFGTQPVPATQASDGSSLYESEADSGASFTPRYRGAYLYANNSGNFFKARSGLDVITDDGTASTPTTGTLNASTPRVTSSISDGSTPPTTGTLAASTPRPTSSITGASLTTGTLVASTPRLTSSISETGTTTGTLAASTPRLTSAISGSASGRTVYDENAITTGAQPRANWLDGVTSESMPAFARSSYYAPGSTARFSVDYNQAFTAEVWRFGHYFGNGARKLDTVSGTPTAQPAAVTIPGGNGAVTCTAWSENLTWAVPADATPGWYQLLLRGQSGALGFVLFCVTDTTAKKKTLVVSSDLTWGAAYNGYGGNNLYGAVKGIGTITDRAYCVSLDRPVITKDYVPQTHFFNSTYPFLKYIESLGVDAGYATIEQIHNDPTILDGRDVVVLTGHNEYVPQTVVTKVKQLLGAGATNLVNIASNDMFWRVTLAGTTFPTGATSTSTGRVVWCKKDTMNGPTGSGHNGGTPFTTAADWTGSWQDTRWSLREPPSDYLGDRFVANGIRTADQVKVPAAMQGSPAWRNCAGIAALTSGQTYAFVAGSLGFEWDIPETTGPAQKAFSASTVDLTGNTADVNGQFYNLDSTPTHGMTMGRSAGGSYIANLNSDQWPWTLDQIHLRGTAAADDNARQMMLNVLTDLGSVATPASVSAASLTMPTRVSNVSTAYQVPTSTDPTTGTLAASTPRVTSSISGTSVTTGTLTATTPLATSSITGTSVTTGTLAAATPRLTSSIAEASITTGTLAATTPRLTSSISGAPVVTGTLAANLPRLVASISGVQVVAGLLTGRLPQLTSVFGGPKGPTPDFDRITLKWAGVTLDGNPVTGALEISYSGISPLLDDDPDLPIAIYTGVITQALTTRTVPVGVGTQVVGYAEFTVPATDDPDITGSGGTYTLTEKLSNAQGRKRTFVASKDTPGGVIWLNRLNPSA